MIRALLLAVLVAHDLDVAVPTGSPFDYTRRPPNHPTIRPKRKETATQSGDGDRNRGETVAEERDPSKTNSSPAKKPSLSPRSMPVKGMTSADLTGHIKRIGPDPKPHVNGYPPEVGPDLYLHTMGFFLLELIHPDQVSPREITEYLIEIGEASREAGRAVRGEGKNVKDIVDDVNAAVGEVPQEAPKITGPWTGAPLEKAREVARSLVERFPYEEGFGTTLFAMGADGLPFVMEFAQNATHRLLRRNAVLALRLYDDDSLVPVLRKLLESDDKVVRNRALAGLVLWRDPECVPWLLKKLGTGNSFESYAVWALGRIGDPSALPPLLAEAKRRADDDLFLWDAIPAIARLGVTSDEARRALLEIAEPKLGLSRSSVRHKVIAQREVIALARLGDASARKAFSAITTEPRAGKLGTLIPPEIYAANEEFYEETKRSLAGGTPEDAALKVFRRYEPELKKYPGVKEVALEGRTIRIRVETEQDAADLRTFVGSSLDGLRVEFDVRK